MHFLLNLCDILPHNYDSIHNQTIHQLDVIPQNTYLLAGSLPHQAVQVAAFAVFVPDLVVEDRNEFEYAVCVAPLHFFFQVSKDVIYLIDGLLFGINVNQVPQARHHLHNFSFISLIVNLPIVIFVLPLHTCIVLAPSTLELLFEGNILFFEESILPGELLAELIELSVPGFCYFAVLALPVIVAAEPLIPELIVLRVVPIGLVLGQEGAVRLAIHHDHVVVINICLIQLSRSNIIWNTMRSYSSRTKIGSRERAVMKDVLEKIMSHKLAYQFIHPVDWQALGLYDYPSIIPEPIDLTTIKTKLQHHQYQCVEHFFRDIEQVWANCITYNTPTHWLSTFAKKLNKDTQRYMRNYFPSIRAKETRNTKKPKDRFLQIQLQTNGPEKEKLDVAGGEEQDLPSIKSTASTDIPSKHTEPAKAETSQQAVELRQHLLNLLSLESDNHVGMIFLMMRRRCPSAISYQSDGDMKVDLELVDAETIERALFQLQRWNQQ